MCLSVMLQVNCFTCCTNEYVTSRGEVGAGEYGKLLISYAFLHAHFFPVIEFESRECSVLCPYTPNLVSVLHSGLMTRKPEYYQLNLESLYAPGQQCSLNRNILLVMCSPISLPNILCIFQS